MQLIKKIRDDSVEWKKEKKTLQTDIQKQLKKQETILKEKTQLKMAAEKQLTLFQSKN